MACSCPGNTLTGVRHAADCPVAPLAAGQGVQWVADPWAQNVPLGRSTGMRCASCMWFAPKGAVSSPNGRLGRCRRHAPTMSGFPAVFEADWCGDHKLDESKA